MEALEFISLGKRWLARYIRTQRRQPEMQGMASDVRMVELPG